MAGEREWVETVRSDLESELTKDGLIVKAGCRLPYAFHIESYKGEVGSADEPEPIKHEYQTDLLIAERKGEKSWVPRVVVEFKLGKVTSHDALTYSTKAATHKHVHPYLRYGIVVGGFDKAVPKRLIRHGQNFDFMATIASETLSVEDRKRLLEILVKEVRASQNLSNLMSDRSNIWLLHRHLEVSFRK